MTRFEQTSGVTCLRCPTGGEYVAEEGPGTGWVYLSERGWLCPSCSERAIDRGEEALDELAMRERGDVVVRPDQPVYVITGEKRSAGEGEDFAIGPYTVGTSDGSRVFRRRKVQIVRKVWPS